MFHTLPIHIGRDPSCDVILPSKNVSRKHAEIFFEKERLYIQDYESSNGVVINGTKIKRVEIDAQTEIHISEYVLMVSFFKEKALQNSEETRLELLDDVLEHKKDIKNIKIEVLRKENALTYFFNKNLISFGRDLKNDVVLNDDSVSRNHAFIEIQNNQFFVSDLKSKNGTFLNGEKVEKKPFSLNDVIEIGSVRIRIHEIEETSQENITRVVPLQDIKQNNKDFFKTQLKEESLSDKKHTMDWEDLPSVDEKEDSSIQPISVVVTSKKTVKKYTFKKRKIVLGRDKNCDILLDEPYVSKRHAVLEYDGFFVSLKDLNSSNGIYYKEQKKESVFFEHKDHFYIGEFSIEISWPSAKPFVQEKNVKKDSSFDSDEEDDDFYKPSFSLKDKIAQFASKAEHITHALACPLEIAVYENNILLDVGVLNPGEYYYTGPRSAGVFHNKNDEKVRIKLFEYASKTTCLMHVLKGSSVVVKKHGIETPLDTHHKKNYTLHKDDVISIKDQNTVFIAHFINDPHKQFKSLYGIDVKKAWNLFLINIFSVCVHLALVFFVGFYIKQEVRKSSFHVQEFTEVSLSDIIEKEKPVEEPKKVQDVAKPSENKTPVVRKKPVSKKPVVEKKPVVSEVKQKTDTTSSKKAQSVLGLLKKIGSSSVPTPPVAGTNVAVAKVSGKASGFKVSGVVSKIATDDIVVGSGDGPLVKGGSNLLRNEKTPEYNAERTVEGVVKSSPKAIKTKGGFLDKSEIDKVVSKYIEKIQRCYQRELSKNTTLSGKIHIEWVIGLNGRVVSAKQTYSDMKSSEVSECILEIVRSWQFPSPEGGEVVVNFPWIFKGF